MGGIVSALVAAATMLLGGFLGGKWGERFHRRADAAIVGMRSGGIAGTGERQLEGNVERGVEERRVDVER